MVGENARHRFEYAIVNWRSGDVDRKPNMLQKTAPTLSSSAFRKGAILVNDVLQNVEGLHKMAVCAPIASRPCGSPKKNTKENREMGKAKKNSKV
eukprot:NODE_7660_length_391_cov_44.219298_g5830_i1.p1 GENE.NODE_7660_length_391_cov_44.219298_g5830_i1~~NODE_7660_length_391_cov_44.219298_g5830_i1.p1  ORF type:complete len:111 (-),score=18.36 NODE_7660_length_391_cov_44.219298_g5830_i1:59-343(-)